MCHAYRKWRLENIDSNCSSMYPKVENRFSRGRVDCHNLLIWKPLQILDLNLLLVFILYTAVLFIILYIAMLDL